MSETKTLWQALLAFHADPPKLKLDANNPHFNSRFVSLHEVMEKIRPKLTEVGLVWTTTPGYVEGVGSVLKYRLTHAATGEHIEDHMPLMLTKPDPQGQGSGLTYARRYTVLAVLGLVADEDDDGQAASAPQTAGEKAPSQKMRNTPPKQMTGPASPAQLKFLKTLESQHSNIAPAARAAVGIGLTDTPDKAQASQLIQYLKGEEPIPTGQSDVPAEPELFASEPDDPNAVILDYVEEAA